MTKYIILDFGNVLAYPTSGDWFITPKFKELVNMDIFDVDKYKSLNTKYSKILSERLITLEEEFEMFKRYYDNVLKDCYHDYDSSILYDIAYNRTFEFDKYGLYDDVVESLNNLRDNYKLIMVSDNWPCGIEYLKHYNIHDVFDKIYISSIYDCEKKDGLLFDYPIKDYNIKDGEAIFVDDKEELLDVAVNKGLDVLLMDRSNDVLSSKYNTISSMGELVKKL